MKEKGFVTSALLYGILSMFLLLILGTVAVIGNRKLANDKIKQSALDDVQQLSTETECFVYELDEKEGWTITAYKQNTSICGNVVYIPSTVTDNTGATAKVESIGPRAFDNLQDGMVTIGNNITHIDDNAFAGSKRISFILVSNRLKNDTSGKIWGATNSTLTNE